MFDKTPSNHNRRVILTRPATQAQGWASALTEAGFDMALLPLIDIAFLPAPDAQLGLGNYDAIFLVSRNALDGLLHWVGSPALLASHALLLSPGPGTAQALRDLGIAPARIIQPEAHALQDSAALWQKLASTQTLKTEQRLLIVKGSDEAPDSTYQGHSFGDKARALGLAVDEVCSYQRRAPVLSVAQAELAQEGATDGSIWLFSSSQAIANLHQALAELRFANTPCIATHPRIASSAQALGFDAHLCQPQFNDIAHRLHQLQQNTK